MDAAADDRGVLRQERRAADQVCKRTPATKGGTVMKVTQRASLLVLVVWLGGVELFFRFFCVELGGGWFVGWLWVVGWGGYCLVLGW